VSVRFFLPSSCLALLDSLFFPFFSIFFPILRLPYPPQLPAYQVFFAFILFRILGCVRLFFFFFFFFSFQTGFPTPAVILDVFFGLTRGVPARFIFPTNPFRFLRRKLNFPSTFSPQQQRSPLPLVLDRRLSLP